jgi:hypothetical protein
MDDSVFELAPGDQARQAEESKSLARRVDVAKEQQHGQGIENNTPETPF